MTFNFAEYRAAIRSTRRADQLEELRRQINAAPLSEAERDKLLRLIDKQEGKR